MNTKPSKVCQTVPAVFAPESQIAWFEYYTFLHSFNERKDISTF